MKRALMTSLGSAFALVAMGTGPVLGHHGRGGIYDRDRTIQIEGTVDRMVWRNPHVTFFIDVTDENGQVTTWSIEHSNISTLARLGYGRQILRPGMEVTVEIYPGIEERPLGLCRKVILSDGTEIFIRGVSDSNYNPLADIN